LSNIHDYKMPFNYYLEVSLSWLGMLWHYIARSFADSSLSFLLLCFNVVVIAIYGQMI
jgi:hypothetical protein